MNRTKIGWVKNPDGSQGYSSNPIRGLCGVACWYCYEAARRRRFKISPNYEFHREELGEIERTKEGRGIFLGSAIELFHEAIPHEWRRSVFKTIRSCPQHRFYILTKLPQNIDRPMPDNVWLGISITKNIEIYPKIKGLYRARAKTKFVSFEPLLEDVSGFRFQGYLGGKIDWMIIGKLTGCGKKYDPKIEWIESLVGYARIRNIPIFLKNNLKDIWGESLIQEFPR